MRSLLFPAASRRDLLTAAKLALTGAVLAGLFGIVHDQITYTISPEYFTRLKFDQFREADFGFPPRIFVAEIGFLGTWWVGLIGAWFLTRVAIGKWEQPQRQVWMALLGIVGVTAVFGIVGYFAEPAWFAARVGWPEALAEMGVADTPAFHRVAAIHLASYAGAILGGLTALAAFLRKAARV